MIRFYDSLFFGDEGMMHKLKDKEAKNLAEYFDLCLELAGAGLLTQKKFDCFKTHMWQNAIDKKTIKVGMVISIGKEKHQIDHVSSVNIKASGKTISFSDITDVQEKKKDVTEKQTTKSKVATRVFTEYGLTDVEILKVLSQMHPDNKIRQDAIEEVKGIVQKLYTKLITLPMYSIENFQTVLPGELGKHAYSELKKYTVAERMLNHPAIFHSVDGKGTNIILEYIVAELLELSGNVAHDFHKVNITPDHLKTAIGNDVELSQMMAIINDKKLMYEFTWKYGDSIHKKPVTGQHTWEWEEGKQQMFGLVVDFMQDKFDDTDKEFEFEEAIRDTFDTKAYIKPVGNIEAVWTTTKVWNAQGTGTDKVDILKLADGKDSYLGIQIKAKTD